MNVFHSETLDPYINLSTEKWLLRSLDYQNSEILFLYKNAPSVIIGRFQNPWLECDLEKMNDNRIPLVRRESGGGAVYHDSGNLNFSFITEKDKLIKEERTEIVLRALKSLGIDARAGDRNDLFIGIKKISGSAGKYTSKRALHHGTLLINTDLNALESYLLTKDYHSRAVNSRGIPSIRARVGNITESTDDVNAEQICESIERETAYFLKSQIEKKVLSENEMLAVPSIREQVSELQKWDWRFGKTPAFSIRLPVKIPGMEQQCNLNISKGFIKSVQCEKNQDIFSKALTGKPFDYYSGVFSPV